MYFEIVGDITEVEVIVREARPAGLKLRVRELDRALTVYAGLLGLEQQAGADARLGPDGVRLGLPGRRFYLDLVEDSGAGLRPYPSVGLYHFALLLPDRRSLGSVFQKLIQAGWDFEGAADHGVSEALYLRDPENNGIELYRDRPRESWSLDGDLVRMVTEPLDVRGLLGESPGPAPLDEGARLGHMHLHVDDLAAAAHFYGAVLGLATRASLPGAEFLAAGDYCALNLLSDAFEPQARPLFGSPERHQRAHALKVELMQE